jgi:hypothetical protein
MNSKPKIPSADFHSPDELLANAKAMFSANDPKLLRGVVLESITALEAFVHRTVFDSLKGKLDPLFVTWLETKTRMDFDSRLSVLTPVATGLPIDKSSELWDGYQKARRIRHDVVHAGRKVTRADASLVMETVREWLSYLGSTVELERMLLELKAWVEKQRGLSIPTEAHAIQLATRYFHQLTQAMVVLDLDHIVATGSLRSDMILDFDPRKVLVETKLVKEGRNLRDVIDDAVRQVDQMRKAARIQQACVIVFIKGKSIIVPDKVERHLNGEILSIGIKLFTE